MPPERVRCYQSVSRCCCAFGASIRLCPWGWGAARRSPGRGLLRLTGKALPLPKVRLLLHPLAFTKGFVDEDGNR